MRSVIEKKSLYLLQLITPLTAILVPIFFLTNTVDYFTFNKFYLVSVLASISLILWSIHNIASNKLVVTTSPISSSFLALVLSFIFSAILVSPTKVLSLTGSATLFISLFIIFFTTNSVTKSYYVVKNIIFSLLFSNILVSIVSILHYFKLTSNMPLISSLTSSNYFNLTGGIVPALSLTIPILIGTIFYTASTKEINKKIILFTVCAILSSATIINLIYILPKDTQSPIKFLPLGPSWNIALDVLKFPLTALLGTGPETYLSSFTRFRPASLNQTTLWNMRFTESGSFLLTILTTTGLVGVISFILLFIKAIGSGIRLLKEQDTKPELLFLVTALSAFFIETIFFPVGLVSLTSAALLLTAITVLQKNQGFAKIKDIHIDLSTRTEQTNHPLNSFLPWVSLVSSVTLLSIYWYFGVSFYQASVLLNQAKVKISSDLTGSFFKQAQALEKNQYDPSYHIVLSQTYQQVALFYLQKQSPTSSDKQNAADTMQRAIDAARNAAVADPFNALVWENLSTVYQSFIGGAQGATDLAASNLAQAITLDPTNPKPRLQLGILFFNIGDADQAIKLINQSIDLKKDWNTPYFTMAQIYQAKKETAKSVEYLKQGLIFTDPKDENYEKVKVEIEKLEATIK